MDSILRFAENAMGGQMQQPSIQGHPQEGGHYYCPLKQQHPQPSVCMLRRKVNHLPCVQAFTWLITLLRSRVRTQINGYKMSQVESIGVTWEPWCLDYR